MKNIMIILGILGLVAIAIVGWMQYDGVNKELTVVNAKVTSLTIDNSKLFDDNTKLIKNSHLRSFVNEKELQRFLAGDDTDSQYANEEYSSKACIYMMKNARDAGFWIGLLPVNYSSTNLISAIAEKMKGSNIVYDIYLITIVDDNDLYIVDPADDERFVKIMTMSADFEDYYNPTPAKFR
jgi:hypothetical protein